jgi:hypothetical protein
VVAVVLLGGVGRWNGKRTHHAHTTHKHSHEGVVGECLKWMASDASWVMARVRTVVPKLRSSYLPGLRVFFGCACGMRLRRVVASSCASLDQPACLGCLFSGRHA